MSVMDISKTDKAELMAETEIDCGSDTKDGSEFQH